MLFLRQKSEKEMNVPFVSSSHERPPCTCEYSHERTPLLGGGLSAIWRSSARTRRRPQESAIHHHGTSAMPRRAAEASSSFSAGGSFRNKKVTIAGKKNVPCPVVCGFFRLRVRKRRPQHNPTPPCRCNNKPLAASCARVDLASRGYHRAIYRVGPRDSCDA